MAVQATKRPWVTLGLLALLCLPALPAWSAEESRSGDAGTRDAATSNAAPSNAENGGALANGTMAHSTVIAVQGSAEQAGAQDGPWTALQAGTQLPAGTWVRAGRGSAVRLVLPDGTIQRVSGTQQIGAAAPPAQQAEAPGRGRQSSGGFFSVLRELFGSQRHSRRAAAESAQGGLGETRFAPTPEQTQAWHEILAQPKLAEGALERIKTAAADYQARNYQNRALALLTRVANDIPDHPALQGLARQARAAYGQPAQVTLSRLESDVLVPLAAGAPLFTQDRVRVEYQSETESYPLLYLHTVPRNGTPSTAVLHGATEPVPPGVRMSLPSPTDFYALDAAVGMEYLWGWSCAAPLMDNARLEQSQAQVQDHIREHGSLTIDVVNAAAPPLCPQSFAIFYAHE